MSKYNRHILAQSQGLAALAGLLVSGKRGVGVGPVPGPALCATVSVPSAALVHDFIRFSGGDPASYRNTVPPHLFCQWSLPLMLKVASGLPYPATKVINAGCTLRIKAPLPRSEALQASAQLTALDENERRVKLTITCTTKAQGAERDALTADLHVLIPLPRKAGAEAADGRSKTSKPKPTVPWRVRELSRARLPRDAGASFAKLTGDFNPIHWLSPYARAVGFRGVILHGFGMFSRVFEGIARGLLSGDHGRLRMLDASFTRPLVLPATCGVYVEPNRNVYLGDAPGGAAYMVGSYEIDEV